MGKLDRVMGHLKPYIEIHSNCSRLATKIGFNFYNVKLELLKNGVLKLSADWECHEDLYYGIKYATLYLKEYSDSPGFTLEWKIETPEGKKLRRPLRVDFGVYCEKCCETHRRHSITPLFFDNTKWGASFYFDVEWSFDDVKKVLYQEEKESQDEQD